MTRTISHVELVYRPGERHLATRCLELLGCRVVDRGGVFFTAFVDPSCGDFTSNVLYASEVTPEQWTFERAVIGHTMQTDAGTAYREQQRGKPQRSTHFGITVPDSSTLDATLARIEQAGASDPELAGRVSVSGVFRPGDPDSLTDAMTQAFVWTDVVAAGLLLLGQHVELQMHYE